MCCCLQSFAIFVCRRGCFVIVGGDGGGGGEDGGDVCVGGGSVGAVEFAVSLATLVGFTTFCSSVFSTLFFLHSSFCV